MFKNNETNRQTNTKRVYWEVSKGRTENKVFKDLMKQTDKQTQNVFIGKYRKVLVRTDKNVQN
jgi:hypothetical protein